MTRELSHIDSHGNARMVDVGDKPITLRVCAARAHVRMAPETLVRISDGSVPKGDALAVARLAGIQAAKRTQDWIPLCHAIPLDAVEVELTPDPRGCCVRIEARARAHARTGVEMEALVAVSAAGLALYDMCKAIDPQMTIEAVQLISKSGGKSGDWQRPSGSGAPGGPSA